MKNEKEKLEANKKFREKHSLLVASETLTSKNGTRGITLIALVITIIVLLILAAVSIATLTGENGILTKAKTAETTNNKAQAEEEMKLLVADWQLEKKANSSADLGDFLNDKLEKGELDKVTDNKDGSYTIERNRYEGTINEDGLGEITKKEIEPPLQLLNPGDTANLTQKDNYVDENEDKATIPEGFKVSEEPDEQSVDTGLVVIAPDDSEFVWVPIPYAIATGEDTAIDAQGNKAMAVKDPTDENYYRGLLYDFKGIGTDSYSELITGCTTTNFDGSTGYREPAYLSGTSYDDSSTNNLGYFTENILKSEYKQMIESVEEYGGFFVGRYETSLNSDSINVASIRGVVPMSAKDDNEQMWYGMYNKQKNYASSIKVKGKEVVGSSMIWGSQWDSIMNWMLTSETEKSKVTAKSEPTTQREIGTSNDVMNKIYDLGNNFYDWTLEAGKGSRVLRGSSYSSPGTPSYRVDNLPYNPISYYGSRLTLYIK